MDGWRFLSIPKTTITWKPPSPTSLEEHPIHAFHTISHITALTSTAPAIHLLTFQMPRHALKFRPRLYLTCESLRPTLGIRGTRHCFALLPLALLFLLPISSYLYQLPPFLPIFFFSFSLSLLPGGFMKTALI